MRERGHAIPVGSWWLNLARRVIASDSRDYDTLGADLAKHLKRKAPFKKALISKFVTGKGPATAELAEAICIEFRIPHPFFIARSYEEAVHIQTVTERHQAPSPDQEEAPVVAFPPPEAGRRKRRATGAPAANVNATPITKRRTRHG